MGQGGESVANYCLNHVKLGCVIMLHQCCNFSNNAALTNVNKEQCRVRLPLEANVLM